MPGTEQRKRQRRHKMMRKLCAPFHFTLNSFFLTPRSARIASTSYDSSAIYARIA